MKRYEVNNTVATFGIGMILCLTEDQAAVRTESLSKKDAYYTVISPVFFKKGEKVGVVSGEVSKNLLNSLIVDNSSHGEDTNPPDIDEDEDNDGESEEYPKIIKISRSNYDVFDKDKNKMNKEPLTKAEATKLLEDISKD